MFADNQPLDEHSSPFKVVKTVLLATVVLLESLSLKDVKHLSSISGV